MAEDTPADAPVDLSVGLHAVSESPSWVLREYVARQILTCPACRGYALGWTQDEILDYPVYVCQSGHRFYPTHGLVVLAQTKANRGYERVSGDIREHVDRSKRERICHMCSSKEHHEIKPGYMPLICNNCGATQLFGRKPKDWAAPEEEG